MMVSSVNSPSSNLRHQPIGTQTYKIITQYGDMLIVKQGVQQQHHHHHHHHPHQSNHQSQTGADQQQHSQSQSQQTRPVIMTFHDLGLNSELQFASFCECDEVKLMLQTFTMIHVNFIGQEFVASPGGGGAHTAAAPLPDDFKYPTVEQMAECIVDICAQMRVRSFVALAVGAGAHIVSSLALLRPDLVHGLFLINPMISSCSITEWLYFKMSAIACNQQIVGGGGGGSSSHHKSDNHSSSNHHHHHHQHHQKIHRHNSSQHSTSSQEDHQTSTSPKHHHHHHHHSGFRKLMNAAARIAHLHHDQQHNQDSQTNSDSEARESGADSPITETSDDTSSIQESPGAPGAGPGGGGGGGPAARAGGSRLRQLILSRNFRTGAAGGHLHRPMPPAAGHTPVGPSQSSSLATSTVADSGLGEAENDDLSGHHVEARKKRSNSTESLGSEPGASKGKRPPLEYLMYHHFGTASFQRYRRPSNSDTGSPGRNVASAGSLRLSSKRGSQSPSEGFESQTDQPEQAGRHRRSSGGAGDCASSSASASGQNSPASGSLRLRRARQGLVGSAGAAGSAGGPASRSQDSLSQASSRFQRRSNSVSLLSASHLASFGSDRQRMAYVQNVYKQYFSQINPHNLWLFAQSFAKRRTLNLRKDCGAAAHAAAAAAALGTSICAAFVGVAAPAAVANSPQQSAAGISRGPTDVSSSSTSSASRLDEQQVSTAAAAAAAPTTSTSHASNKEASQQAQQQQQHQHQTTTTNKQPQALVAGTKVKRTFTCQTLIMCSSVQIHCERAIKLMSLLNPLQATWIKTDQLLVLEEKPEKVCQALRLFLQGIGYSMSTYERRLRLSSAQGSVSSSADSTGSARSLNERNNSQQQQQQQAIV